MDPTKTGALIRALRKERNMTQKDLAERLHITDRAVSKWERGLCAPDISLLEPLAETLGISILELIQGERGSRPEEPDQAEDHTRQVLDYSKSQLARSCGQPGSGISACWRPAWWGWDCCCGGAACCSSWTKSPLPTGRPASRCTAKPSTTAAFPTSP